ncbi:hypothetical protein AB0C91_10195 [Streptomyces sp. NPDC048674]|uniref:hypothetical protein n=1 Tax=Streptomyces sp. NPDC048674 TaxID=3155491 RepID=UPI00342D885E
MPHQTANGALVAVTEGKHLSHITCYGCNERWTVKTTEADRLAKRHATNCRHSLAHQ